MNRQSDSNKSQSSKKMRQWSLSDMDGLKTPAWSKGFMYCPPKKLVLQTAHILLETLTLLGCCFLRPWGSCRLQCGLSQWQSPWPSLHTRPPWEIRRTCCPFHATCVSQMCLLFKCFHSKCIKEIYDFTNTLDLFVTYDCFTMNLMKHHGGFIFLLLPRWRAEGPGRPLVATQCAVEAQDSSTCGLPVGETIWGFPILQVFLPISEGLLLSPRMRKGYVWWVIFFIPLLYQRHKKELSDDCLGGELTFFQVRREVRNSI